MFTGYHKPSKRQGNDCRVSSVGPLVDPAESSSVVSCREKLVAANMAKMPKMIADWRRERRDSKQKQKEEKARKEKLLAEARERFGYAIDPRSPKFLEMVAEIEKEEKKKKKLMKRRLKQEQAAAPVAPLDTSS